MNLPALSANGSGLDRPEVRLHKRKVGRNLTGRHSRGKRSRYLTAADKAELARQSPMAGCPLLAQSGHWQNDRF